MSSGRKSLEQGRTVQHIKICPQQTVFVKLLILRFMNTSGQKTHTELLELEGSKHCCLLLLVRRSR